MSSMVIVTPVWKAALSEEEGALVRITERTNAHVERVFCVPEGLDTARLREDFPSWGVRAFTPEAFQSVHAYSAWMTSPSLYEAFSDHDLLTVCQTDAVLVKDVLSVDMDGIDYVGAPWVPPVYVLMAAGRAYVASDFDRREGPWWVRALGRPIAVGNGGLSTRRVDAMLRITRGWGATLSPTVRRTVLEDVLLCSVGARQGLRIAPVDQAAQTYAETGVVGVDELPDVVGFHGLRRWNGPLADELLRRYSA